MNFSRIENKINRWEELTESELLGLLENTDARDGSLQPVFQTAVTREPSLTQLVALADSVNRRLNGDTVSFVHNININYTNICEAACQFCAYRKSPTDRDAYILTLDEILNRLEGLNVTEVTFQGGLTRKVTWSEVLGLIRGIKQAYPDIHLHAFSPQEIYYYARQNGVSGEQILGEAREAGLDSLCGTAAEILDDEIRKEICPTKLSTAEWVKIVRTAHRLGIPSSSTIV